MKNNKKKFMMFGLSVALVLTLFVLFLELPSFKLNLLEPNIKAEYKCDFEDPGAYKTFFKKKFGKTVFSADKVDTNTLGEYELNYETKLLWRKAMAKRTVVVKDTQLPVITLTSTGKLTLPNAEYEEEGFTAVDNYDGDITDKVKKEIVNDKVYYTVTDSSGNTAKKVRIIKYGDDKAPEISLYGNKKITLYIGDIYRESGFSAIDNLDGDITKNVRVKGIVNMNKLGSYKIIYEVSDKAGNKAEAQRIVSIVEKPKAQNYKEVNPNGKTIYLTFDDGPSQYTPRLLNVLKKYNVKATFFVVGHGRTEYLDDIVKGGHSIGLHTMTHNYAKLYASEDAFMQEIRQQRAQVKRLTGVDTTLIRFPGGSSNTVSRRYNKGVMTRLTKRVVAEGYQYFDWNVSSGDAGSVTTSSAVYNNVISGVRNFKYSIVLQHDSKGYSVDAVEDIIRWGLSNGYSFKKLTSQSPTVHHPVNN